VNFEEIVVTRHDSATSWGSGQLVVLSCSNLLADTIREIFTDGSVSAVFGGENQLF